MRRFSEPYNATGGLAAEGVINQLGRPDIEPLEVLVREAVQNCWDAKRKDAGGVRVAIGRQVLSDSALEFVRERVLVDPPPGLPLAEHLHGELETLYFADFGTDGLGGPTRADQAGERRDFVDFVRNIGQPPDKDLGGGSFGYGKASFYIASAARTVVIDTLCRTDDGSFERRLIGCALGENFEADGRPHTGRHWWGSLIDGVPEPVIGSDAEDVARHLGLPDRVGEAGLGTTVMVIAPGVAPDTENDAEDDEDPTMAFIADALAWNFWPRMIDTRGGVRRTMEFQLTDCGKPVRIPDPRTHQRLRGFVEAMDRLREEPGEDDDLLLDRAIESFRPAQHLGRLVLVKGVITTAEQPHRAVPQGARLTADSVHHVALMRNAELVVRYLPGASPVTGRIGYSGVFRCALDVDEAFRKAEPPTHDDWVYRSVPKDGHQRSFVKIALERIARHCREAAGYDASMAAVKIGTGVPLGEFADSLAALMPGFSGPGARRSAPIQPRTRRRRRGPGRTAVPQDMGDVWVEGSVSDAVEARSLGPSDSATPDGGPVGAPSPRPPRAPQARATTDPRPTIAADGSAVIRYPFELRAFGSRVRLTASVEVMANDGGQVEVEAPLGSAAPAIVAWIDPSGHEHRAPEVELGPDGVDGAWSVDVQLVDEAMMRVDVVPVLA